MPAPNAVESILDRSGLNLTEQSEVKQKQTLGDFLMIIEGPSDPQRLLEWSEAEEFRVTPEKLKAIGIECEWARRPQMT